MRILFVSANPTSTRKLDLADELRNFQHCLRGHDIRLMLLPAAQLDDLQIAVESNSIDIVHFSGHAADEGILMRRSNGVEELVPVEELHKIFKDANVKVAVLNACETASTANALKGVVGTVIGTTEKVKDTTAKLMTKDFYTALGHGEPIKDAYIKATKAVVTETPQGKVYKYPEGNVYMGHGLDNDSALFPKDNLLEGELKIEGQASWDKHFYVTYLDEQIDALLRFIKRNQETFWALLGFGIVVTPLLWTTYNWGNLGTLAGQFWDNRVALIGEKPLLGWLLSLGVAIPPLIATLRSRLLVGDNEELRSKRQLMEIVKSTDEKMSPALQKRLHKLLEQSVRGAKP